MLTPKQLLFTGEQEKEEVEEVEEEDVKDDIIIPKTQLHLKQK